MNVFAQLPPDTRMRNGQLVRSLTTTIDGKEVRIRRPVALTLDEARKHQADFWDGELLSDGKPKGWIRGGVKLEREHPGIESSNTFGYEIDDDDEGEPGNGFPFAGLGE